MTEDVLTEFNETLDEYEKWVANNYGLNPGWEDEVFVVMTLRDDLHELIERLQSQSIIFDIGRLKSTDRRWQEWLLGHTQKGYKMTLKRVEEPKTHCWWWIDHLETLTYSEKDTL